MMKAGPHLLNILHADQPYFEFSVQDLENFLPQKAQQDAWASHTAWCSVDHLNGDQDLQLAYCVLAKLVAEMLDDNCAGVYVPGQHSFIPHNNSLYPGLQKIAECRNLGVIPS